LVTWSFEPWTGSQQSLIGGTRDIRFRLTPSFKCRSAWRVRERDGSEKFEQLYRTAAKFEQNEPSVGLHLAVICRSSSRVHGLRWRRLSRRGIVGLLLRLAHSSPLMSNGSPSHCFRMTIWISPHCSHRRAFFALPSTTSRLGGLYLPCPGKGSPSNIARTSMDSWILLRRVSARGESLTAITNSGTSTVGPGGSCGLPCVLEHEAVIRHAAATSTSILRVVTSAVRFVEKCSLNGAGRHVEGNRDRNQN